MSWLALAGFAFAGSGLSEARVSGFVIADAVRLRDAATPDALEVARLRIGTEVVVTGRDGDRVRVRMVDRPEDWPIEGWMPERLVGGPPSVEALVAAADAASTADRVVLLERAVALDPQREDVWRSLDGAYDAAGITVGRRTRPGDEGGWVGVCRRGRTELVARVDADGVVAPAAGWEVDPDALRAEISRVAAGPWFVAPTGAPEVVMGTPFPAPFLTAAWNDDPSPWAPQPDPETDANVIVLGPCVADGPVATVPLWSARASAFDAVSARSALDVAVGETLGVTLAPTPEPSLVEVSQRVLTTWRSCGGDGEVREAVGVALVGPDGAIARSGGPWEAGPVSMGPGSWWGARIGGEQVHVRLSEAEWYLDGGVSVGVVGPGGYGEAHVMLESWGC
jgi:hypothetical protein